MSASTHDPTAAPNASAPPNGGPHDQANGQRLTDSAANCPIPATSGAERPIDVMICTPWLDKKTGLLKPSGYGTPVTAADFGELATQTERMLRTTSVSTTGLEEHANRRERSAQAKGITDPAKLACIRTVEMIDVAKGGLPMLVPGVFKENQRKKENCERVTCVWLDFDGETQKTWSQGIAKLTTAGIAWFAYSSPKNGVKKTPKDARCVRRRLATATSRDMSPAEAERMQRIVPKLLGLTVDDKTCDCSRGFFVGTVDPFTQLVWESHPTRLALDIDAILAQAPAPESPPIEGQSTDGGESADEEEGRRLALTMPPAIQGQSGGATTLGFMRALVWGLELGRATAKKIFLEFYNPRCQPPWSDDAQIEHKLDDASKPEGAPYTKGSLRQTKPPAILQSRRDAQNILLWESEDRGFQPVALGALRLRIRELSLPIELGRATESGWKPFSPPVIVEIESKTFGESIYDFSLRTSRYEPNHDRVVVGYPVRKIAATYDAAVDTWFRELGGPQYARLEQWIAACTQRHIQRLAATLVILGRPDVGKSLFACAAAGLWGVNEPAKGDLLIARFNGDLTKCPIVFDDEAELFGSKRLSTKRFRELAQSVERSVERKGLERFTLRGAMRLIVAGNGVEDINFTDVSGPEVVQAVNDRLLVVDTKGRDENCKKALARLRLPGGYVCDRERITRHMAWIGETVSLLEERFVGAAAGAQAVLSGHVRNYPDVWASLVAWLDVSAHSHGPWLIHGDALFVDPNAYFTGTQGLQVDRKDVHAALLPFKIDEQRPRVKNQQGGYEKRRRMWRLDATALVDALGLDNDDIDELLKRLDAAAKEEK